MSDVLFFPRPLRGLARCSLLAAALSCGNGADEAGGGVPPTGQGPAPNGAGSDGAALPEPGNGGSPGAEDGVDPDLPLAAPAPAGTPGARYLSDACALQEQNGWGPLERDLSNGEQAGADGGPLSVAGVVYDKGLGAHAPAEVAFPLARRCTRLRATVGVDDEMDAAGSVRFVVFGDGVLLAETDLLTGASPAEALDVDVTGVDELRLVVDGGDGTGSDHADWADAQVICADVIEPCVPARASVPSPDGYELVWSDEFDVPGTPNPDNWSFENGFVRNEEAQWYQPDNASVRAGFLLIEGRRERTANPNYRPGSGDWKTSRELAEYTSSSLHSRGKQSFRFGRLEMRARFPAQAGLWPAWWMLGNDGEWPWNGEVDILEFYGGSLHANFVVGTDTQWVGNWDAVATPLSALGDADWDAQFHVYRMDWDDTRIALFVDGRPLNDMRLSELRNPDGQSPFSRPAYTLLNLAIGGQAGGDPSGGAFPVRYEVDYVRVFQAR